MKKWGIKARLALGLTGHVVLLLFLAFYLNVSLLSIHRHDAEYAHRQKQLESVSTLPPLVHDLETSLISYLKNHDQDDLTAYQQSRVIIGQHLQSLQESSIPLDYFEQQRRSLAQEWLDLADSTLKSPPKTPVQIADLKEKSGKILQQFQNMTGMVRDEVDEAQEGLKNEEMDEVRDRVLLMWGLVGLITCMTTLIQYFASNSIIRPLQQLGEVVNRFQKGDVSVRAKLKSGGEIQTLGETFDDMADNIQRNQEALHQANVHLEQRVAEKTRELEENNLKLQDASRQKDQFFATLSHELRTPLTPILSCAHLLQEEKQLSPPDEKNVQTIERNALALSRMIDELLNLSAVINQKLHFSKEKTELGDWAGALLDTLRPAWERKGITLVFHPASEPIEAEIDPARLAQVLTNLINNAVKFTESGGAITVRLTADTEKILLAVTDNGIGLPREELSRIFEMFHQANASQSQKAGGLGIGLTVARSLAELHGGGLTAESAGPGQGATFTLWLPRDKPSVPLPKEPKLSLALERLHGQRVLLVEDSPDALEALTRIFQRRQCEVFTAQDGASGLARARETKPDIILSDIGLPGLNGLQMIAQVRQDPALRHVIAIALSGLGRSEDIAAAHQAGFDLHLLKPIEISVLDQKLIESLENREKTSTQVPR